MTRALSPALMQSLETGLLAPLAERVRGDHTLYLALRGEGLNLYYRGANLMRVDRAAKGFEVFFDAAYASPGPSPAPSRTRLTAAPELAAWCDALAAMKDCVDRYLARHGKAERALQQRLVDENNRGRVARQSDVFIADIEYAEGDARFDALGVLWSAESAHRKDDTRARLVLLELKYGDEALTGAAGLEAHLADLARLFATPGRIAALEAEVLAMFEQQRALGLINVGKPLRAFGAGPPWALLVLANHNPRSEVLRRILAGLGPLPFELRIARASLMGLGLYEASMRTVDAALREGV